MDDEGDDSSPTPSPPGCSPRLGLGDAVAILYDAQVVFVGEDLEPALVWLGVMLRSGELEP